ncbi:hypothetical protein HNQ07_000426 [Deinococcus metalli]|uniref:Uncharacterized protein n=1 Tax=Deinococcus metalli TaxID=1141878 RepID=A0A7W8KB41_9DEIO|nr:hypothetical protein [Deinococcus metalli]MBB5374982.1 hypothetical protein [Deinococcus metalli]GHF32308.1 hypothetical protein GCM10017781_06170 [Deinococcus metalli]
MKARTRGRLARMEAQRTPAGVPPVIVRHIVNHGPDGAPVNLRMERREVNLYPADRGTS